MWRGLKLKVLLLCMIWLCIKLNQGRGNKDAGVLQLVTEWHQLIYGFQTQRDRLDAQSYGNLVQKNGVPIDVAPHYNYNGELRIFVTIPRFTNGIPYTLATKSPNTNELIAYPSYEWHSGQGTSNCDGIVSAFRVSFTPCNQMWVIDSGLIGSNHICSPQLLLFDLTTDKLLHRYRFNSTLYTPSASIFIAPILKVHDPPPLGACRDVSVYVPDVNYHGLVVYNYKRNVAWRVEHKYMFPDPDYGTHTIAGESFTLMDGIFGVAIDERNLYFHPLASTTEYFVPLEVLNNQQMSALQASVRPLGKRSSECTTQAFDSAQNLFCVTLNPIKLISWNSGRPYAEHYFCELPVNPKQLEFVSGMKVVRNFFGEEELWMLSNRFQKISAGTQNPNEVNFRILKGKISDMFGNGQCGRTNYDLHNSLIFN